MASPLEMSSPAGVATATLDGVDSQSPEAPVSCRNVTVRYDRTIAVDRVTFDVHAGEVLGLLGPNGAGKTSLIRALTTMLPVAAGQATVAGVDRRHADLIRSRIGVLPESSGYPDHQTAIEYVAYHGRLYGIPGPVARERGIRLLADMGLADRADVRIRTFSRGMRQRLGMARALINKPRVLFLDEPTLGLDPAGQDDVLRHVRETATERGIAVILTSHLLDEVNRICDRVVILNKGRVVSTGSVDEVAQQSDVAKSVRARVALADVDRAIARLSDLPDASSVQRVASRPGEIRVEVTNSDAKGANLVAGALISEGIPLLSLELEGATLNDVFLRLTKDSEGTQT